MQEGLLDPSYVVWPDTTLHPNFYMAVTGLSALALAEWRDAAPERIDAALRKADVYLDDDARLAPASARSATPSFSDFSISRRRKTSPA
jgi:hypothetical protein